MLLLLQIQNTTVILFHFDLSCIIDTAVSFFLRKDSYSLITKVASRTFRRLGLIRSIIFYSAIEISCYDNITVIDL